MPKSNGVVNCAAVFIQSAIRVFKNGLIGKVLLQFGSRFGCFISSAEQKQNPLGVNFMIYFDNAATGGFKPDSVVIAATAALKFCANPGRSGHKLSLACLERVYSCRKLLCSFFGAYSYDRVIFTKNCTEALNIAISGVFKKGDEVVTTVAEHNSVLRPLQHIKGKGVKIK